MKTLSWIATAAAALALTGLAAAQAPKATVDLYKAQCAACHGPDGSAQVPAGKALGARDFHADVVQSQTDDQLADVIANGKLKMPAFNKKLTPAQIKSLVAYVRELGGKK